jgi:hypothetical protein
MLTFYSQKRTIATYKILEINSFKFSTKGIKRNAILLCFQKVHNSNVKELAKKSFAQETVL